VPGSLRGDARAGARLWLDSYRDLWKQQQATRTKLDRFQKKVKVIGTRRTVRATTPTRIRKYSFAFTGGIDNWPRELKLYPTIARYGGNVIEYEGIRKADCLVHGDLRSGRETTRKLRVARQDGIEVISQGDFFRILDNEMRLRKRNRSDRTTRR
jgi:hypothetical protein